MLALHPPSVNCLILGHSGSGRRCLAMRLRDGVFPASFPPPRSPALVEDYGCAERLRLRVFSHTSVGVTNVPASPASCLELSDVLLLCCPLSQSAAEAEWRVLEWWLPYLRHYGPRPLPRLVLVGTQSDHRAADAMSRSAGESLARKIGAFGYVECSALSGHAMEALVATALEAKDGRRRKGRKLGGCPIQ